MQRKSSELLEQVKEIIESYDFAVTLRQIYYQLVTKQIIPNQQKYYAKLSRLCLSRGYRVGIRAVGDQCQGPEVFGGLQGWQNVE